MKLKSSVVNAIEKKLFTLISLLTSIEQKVFNGFFYYTAKTLLTSIKSKVSITGTVENLKHENISKIIVCCASNDEEYRIRIK